ncbi:MAG: hypothetical protein WBZ20_02275 [Nitrososphaeraceae archaeon]
MKEIILIEQRSFSFADFREFERGGKKYQMKHGAFRNNISRLKKRGEVELAFSPDLLSIIYQAKNSKK